MRYATIDNTYMSFCGLFTVQQHSRKHAKNQQNSSLLTLK